MKTLTAPLWYRSLALGAAAVLHAAVASAQTAEATHPHAWQRWENALTSTRHYDNPYADVTLRVRYTGPGGRSMKAHGFWDGGNVFRIRCAFPAAGAWQWETECSDAGNVGLHGQRGTVEVAPYRGNNALYRRGFLQVSPNRRYLTYGDGTPFLWMADTAWATPMKASDEEWNVYLADRIAKHFTVIQVATVPRWESGSDRQGQRPFHDKACRQGNPAFWRNYERKIQRANDEGLVVMIEGLMEPVFRYPEPAAASVFARNMVARFFGNFVVLSPSADSKFMPLGDEVGLAIREATTVHLITQHPGTPSKEPTPIYTMQYYDRPYLDFAGIQTGHNGGNRQRCAHHAIEWILHAYRHEPHKPVLNLEAMYDGQGEQAWQAVDARSAAWWSWLSGAKGYAYGAGDVAPKIPKGSGGVWNWITEPRKYDYWRNALQWESAFQMQHLHDFLAAIEWWHLEPAHELICNQPDDVTQRMVLARLPGRDFAVAYLPGNDGIEVSVAAFSAPLAARWFDPVRGRSTPVPGSIKNQGVRRFEPPGKGDWVLVLERAGSP